MFSRVDAADHLNMPEIPNLSEGLKISLAPGKTEAFQKLGTKFYDKIFPGYCEGITPCWTDDYWRCFVRHYSSTFFFIRRKN